jgi:hypothetical protein
MGYCLLLVEGFKITLRHTTNSVGLLWTGDKFYAEISTWQYTTLKRQASMFPQEFDPQSQQANGLTPTPQTVRLLGSA